MLQRISLLVVVFCASSLGAALAEVGRNTNVLNPNTAGKEELLALPHLDEALVAGILEARPFLSQTALAKALGTLSDEARSELFVTLFVPINLNTASREEILLVPGVGRRMAHEFEEYRPYKAMAQFRREIGKYVDEDEVARLERYVTLGE